MDCDDDFMRVVSRNTIKKKMRKKKLKKKKKKTPGLSKKITNILQIERSSKQEMTFLDPNYSELETEHWGIEEKYWLEYYSSLYDNYNPWDLPCDDSDYWYLSCDDSNY